MKLTIIVIMMCLIPIISSSHTGKEVHCNKNDYHVPCYDELQHKVINKLKKNEESTSDINDIHSRHHFMEFFNEGVLVCGNIFTDNLIARDILLDPSDDWEYGIYQKWVDNSTVSGKIKELGNFYFCRYFLY